MSWGALSAGPECRTPVTSSPPVSTSSRYRSRSPSNLDWELTDSLRASLHSHRVKGRLPVEVQPHTLVSFRPKVEQLITCGARIPPHERMVAARSHDNCREQGGRVGDPRTGS